MNASPFVLRSLFGIAGALTAIAGLFIIVFLPPAVTLSYLTSWALLVIGAGLLGVAWKLPDLVARKSPLPYLLLAGTILVRVVNGRNDFFGGEHQRTTLIGMAIGLLVGGYLWYQVWRLQRGVVT